MILDYELIFQYATTDNEAEAYEIMLLITSQFIDTYDNERERFAEDSGIDLTGFDDESFREEYAMYVMSLVIDMRERIRKEQEKLFGLTEVAFLLRLHKIVTDNYNTLEVSELGNAKQLGQLRAASAARDKNNAIKIYKRWIAHPDCCDLCWALNGTVKPIDEPFLVEGQSVELPDGKEFIYKYIDRLVAIAHPNDRCSIEFFTET